MSIVTNPSLFPVMIQGGEVTGQAFNGSSSAFNGDPFLFVTLNGAIEGWRPAWEIQQSSCRSTSSNSYDGATLVTVNGNEYLLAANHATGNIDVFNGTADSARLARELQGP